MDIEQVKKEQICLATIRANNKKLDKYIKTNLAILSLIESGVLHTYKEHKSLKDANSALNVVIARTMAETTKVIFND